jgi:hypothetical protein
MCTWLLSLLLGDSELGLQQEECSIYSQPMKIEEMCWYAAKAAIAAQLMQEEVMFPRIIMMVALVVRAMRQGTHGGRSIALLRSCRVSDSLLCGLIPGPKFVCLLQRICGMTSLQVKDIT